MRYHAVLLLHFTVEGICRYVFTQELLNHLRSRVEVLMILIPRVVAHQTLQNYLLVVSQTGGRVHLQAEDEVFLLLQVRKGEDLPELGLS